MSQGPDNDGCVEGVTGMNHGGPGHDDRQNFMPVNSSVGDVHDSMRGSGSTHRRTGRGLIPATGLRIVIVPEYHPHRPPTTGRR